jgi:hypothetical protein
MLKVGDKVLVAAVVTTVTHEGKATEVQVVKLNKHLNVEKLTVTGQCENEKASAADPQETTPILD